jgi:hypothetical protein
VLHHLAGGRPPFDPDDPFGLSRWLLCPKPLRPAPGLPEKLARLTARLTDPRPVGRPPTAEAALEELVAGGAAAPGPSPLRAPRGFRRSLRRALERVRAGEGLLLERRVDGAPLRRALLSRAAAEGIRAGLAPLRPVGHAGAPSASAGLARRLRARRGAGRPPLFLLEGEAWALGALRGLRPPFLLLLLRGGRAYNSGP